MTQQKPPGLMPIGAFSNAVQLSIKALRLYDQLDIFKPTYTDVDSGYRYYAMDQLPTARLIRMLREMNMPLATIRQVLDATPTQAETLVREHCQRLQAKAEQALHLAQGVLNVLKGDPLIMSHDVQIKTVANQQVLSLTQHVKIEQLDSCITSSIVSLQKWAATQSVTPSGPPFGIYHGAIDGDSDGPIEVCLPVDRPLKSSDSIQAYELIGGRVATVSLTGTACQFPEILRGYDAIVDWLHQNGYQPEGPPREIWYSVGAGSDAMAIEWLFKEA